MAQLHPTNPVMMEQYLKQQQSQFQNVSGGALAYTPSEAGSSVYGGRRIENALIETPDNNSLEEFKHQVKLWMEIDNQVKKLAQITKEKKAVQKQLTDKILGFMSKFNIEDLNTKEGKLRYKVTLSKPTVKKTNIKEKLLNFFEHDPATAKKVVDAVFEEGTDENKVEKVSLRRLKSARVMNV